MRNFVPDYKKRKSFQLSTFTTQIRGFKYWI